MEDCLDTLLLGRFYKSASIYNNHIRIFKPRCEYEALQPPKHNFRIYEIFGAAKRDEMEIFAKKLQKQPFVAFVNEIL